MATIVLHLLVQKRNKSKKIHFCASYQYFVLVRLSMILEYYRHSPVKGLSASDHHFQSPTLSSQL